MPKGEEYWIEKYQQKDAFWLHDGNSQRPHALLTSGNHSNGFFFSKPVTDDLSLLAEAAEDLVDLLVQSGLDILSVNWVIGPATGATKLAEAVHQVINNRGGQSRWASPVKDETTGQRRMVFPDQEKTPSSGEHVLSVEDVLTTGGSVGLVDDIVSALSAILLPRVAVLVNRSELVDVRGKKIISLIHRPMPIWTPEECRQHYLCSQGSEAISPKRPPENWAKLNASY